MKFIIDAQLPIVLRNWLIQQGHDAIHTIDLPIGNSTGDMEVIKIAIDEERIVISKDSDFLKYYLVNNQPEKILMITTGNITNRQLIRLFELNFHKLEMYFQKGKKIIELDNASIKVHE